MDRHFPTPRLAAAGVTLVVVVLLLFIATIVTGALGRPLEDFRLSGMVAPLPFYLFALWSARGAMLKIGADVPLRSLISPALRRIGWALFLGGMTQVFLVPWLVPGERHSFAFFDVNAITLGAIGVTLVIIARLVAAAEADRAELDEIV